MNLINPICKEPVHVNQYQRHVKSLLRLKVKQKIVNEGSVAI
jgi:hypothetical protein